MPFSKNNCRNPESAFTVHGTVIVVNRLCKVVWYARLDTDEGAVNSSEEGLSDVADLLAELGLELARVGETLSAIETVIEQLKADFVCFDTRLIVVSPLEELEGLFAVAVVSVFDFPDGKEVDSLVSFIRARFIRASSAKVLDRPKLPLVLVVDDNALAVDLNSRFLQRLDCEVLQAVSGDQALVLASENDLALVFMDLHMPGIGGVETTRRLRELSIQMWGRAPYIVGLSAGVTQSERAEAMASGMDCVRLKPPSMLMMREFLDGLSESSEGSPKVVDSNFEISSAHAPNTDKPLVADLSEWEDEGLHRRMVGMLLRQGDNVLDRVRICHDENNWSELKRVIHTFKGGADIVRAHRLSRLMQEAMAAIEDEDFELACQLLERLPNEYSTFKSFVEKRGFTVFIDAKG